MFARILLSPNNWQWLALDTVAKATLLLLLAGGVVLLLRGASAAVRHRVWALTFAAILLLPLVSLLVPAQSWQIIPRDWQAASTTVSVPAAGVPPASTADRAPNAPAPAAISPRVPSVDDRVEQASVTPGFEPVLQEVVEATERVSTENVPPLSAAVEPTAGSPMRESPTGWLTFTWIGGAILVLAPLAAGMLLNLRWRVRGQLLTGAEWQQLLAGLSIRLGLKRDVTLYLGDAEQMPITFGLWHPCIVLPGDALQWSPERRRIVLLHELAHINRYDVPLQMIARLACAVYWFHPLVWWAIRRMRLEREHACDDCVLLAGQEASDYAAHLLDIARGHRSSSPLASAALSMARPSQLEGRLLAVLDVHRCRSQLTALRSGLLTLLAIGIVVGMSVVRPTLRAEVTDSSSREDTLAETQQPSGDSSRQSVVTGTVLSPEGKPVPGAMVEVLAYDRRGWHYDVPGEKDVDHYETRTDAQGAFRLVLPRDTSRPRMSSELIATSEGKALAMKSLDSRMARHHVDLKLHEPKDVRLQLIDMAGHPVAGVVPHLRYARLEGGEFYSTTPYRETERSIQGWPRFTASDEQGYTSIKLPSTTDHISLVIDDERAGAHRVRLDLTDEPASIALEPARWLSGSVTDAETGEPVGGAEVVVMEEPFRSVYTTENGSFRIAGGSTIDTLFLPGRSIIHVYPPPDSDYLFHSIEWEWPNEGLGDAELSIELLRGIAMEGRVVEQDSGEPVARARVYFEPQPNNNPHFNRSSRSRFAGSDMKYATDAEGRFRLPVWPGPGYVLVDGPTLDYVPVPMSLGERYYGKPGLQREYYDGAARINLEPDERPEPITIALQRGVTLRRRVLRPDGQPADAKAYSRTYLQQKRSVHSSLPAVPIENGLLELPGFDPGGSTPLFMIDLKHHCGAMVSPTADEVDLTSPPIRLQPCGSASFRFVTDKGEALADYKPPLVLLVTPGAPSTHHIEPDQPLWSDSVIWENIARRPYEIPKTDADGRVVVHDLIPGATYRLYYVKKEGGWDEDFEFTVEAGETTDVGEVVLPERD